MGKLILNKSKIVIDTKVFLALTEKNLEKFKDDFLSIEVYNDFIKKFSSQKELELFVNEVNEEIRYYIVFDEYLFRLFTPRPNFDKALYVAFVTKRTSEQNQLIHSHNYTLYTKNLLLEVSNNVPVVKLSNGKTFTSDLTMTASNVEKIFSDLNEVLNDIKTRSENEKTHSEQLLEFISQSNNINDLEKEIDINCNLYYTKLEYVEQSKYKFFCSKINKLPKVNESVVIENFKGKIVNVEVDKELCVEILFEDNIDKLPEPGSIIREYNEYEYIIKKDVIEKLENSNTPFTNMINDPVFEELIYNDKFVVEMNDLNEYTYDLNEEQLKALYQGALVKDNGILILGPTSSGKTTVINNLLKYYLANNKKVLLSSSNYNEINNTISHLGVQKNLLSVSYDSNNDFSYKESFEKYRTKIETTIQGKCVSVQRDIEQFEELVKKRIELDEKIGNISNQNETLTKKKFHVKDLSAYYMTFNDLHKSKSTMQKILDDFDVLCEEHNENIKKFKYKINFVYKIKTKSKKSKAKSSYKKEFNKYQTNLKKYKKLYLKFEEKFSENSRKNVNSISTLTTFKEECNYQIDELNNNYVASSFIMNFFNSKKNIIFDQEHLDQLNNYYTLLCEYKDQILEKKVDLSDSFISTINILGVSTKDLLNEEFKNQNVDVVILLDSETILTSDALLALSKANEKIIMVGDLQKNPKMSTYDKGLLTKFSVKDEYLNTSIFDFIYNTTNKESVITLKQQYEMTTSVNTLLSNHYYNNETKVVNINETTLADLESSFVIYDTGNCDKRFETKKDGSLHNKLEIAFVTDMVLPMFNNEDVEITKNNYLNIIAAYDVQATQIINSLVKKKIMSLEDAQKIVKTLDEYEYSDVAIFSFVRSHKKDKKGYIENPSRINRAFAKCRKQLVCVGDMNFINSIESNDKEVNNFTNFMKYINSVAESNTTNSKVVLKKMVVLEDGK